MKNLIFWVLSYSLIMAFSQVLLKWGTNLIGGFEIKGFNSLLTLAFQILKNPFIMGSIVLMVSSFFLWLYILSWFKLGLVFPLTALVYVFVSIMSYFLLGEKLSLHNYLGVAFIAVGIFFLLFK